MDRYVRVSLVILALVLAGPDTGAAAVYSADQGMMPTSSSSMWLEDGLAPELAVVTTVDQYAQSRVFIGYTGEVFDGNKPQCVRNCPAPAGYPYTGRGCNKYYNCRE